MQEVSAHGRADIAYAHIFSIDHDVGRRHSLRRRAAAHAFQRVAGMIEEVPR